MKLSTVFSRALALCKESVASMRYFIPIGYLLTQANFIDAFSQTTISGNVYDGNGGPLTPAGSPYIVPPFSSITIPSGQTLTIQAGVEIRLGQGSYFIVYGRLTADGTGESSIRFTAHTAGQRWGYLEFRSGSTGSLKYCDVEFGGREGFSSLYLWDPASVTIEQCSISRGQGDGLQGYVGWGVTGTLSVTNSTFSNNGRDGIDVAVSSLGTVTLSDNTLTGNAGSAYRLSPNIYPTGGTLSGNGFDGIELTGGTVSVSGSYTMHVLRRGWAELHISSGTTLTLAPGVEVRMQEEVYWTIKGTLIAEGTSSNRIRFTAHTAGQHWGRLEFQSGSTGSLKYCDVEFGGWGGGSSLYLWNPASLVLEQCLVRNSGGDGLSGEVGWSVQSNLNINSSTFTSNGKDGINLMIGNSGSVSFQCNIVGNNGRDGIRLNGGNPTIQYNRISANSGNGLTNAGSSNLNAANNWWGHSSGPGGIGPGSGDEIGITGSGTVNYEPWATVPAFVECGDTIGAPPYITSITPDTLPHGHIQEFIIHGRNFDTDATVYLTRGTRGGFNPGDVPGMVKVLTPNLIVAEFDLSSYDLLGEWDVVVRNPDGMVGVKPVFIIPSIIVIAVRMVGNIGYPVVPPGQELPNALEIINVGNDAGIVLLELTPPAPGIITLKVGSRNEPIWSSETEADKSKAYLLVNLAELQTIHLPLYWGVPPERVIFPPSGNSQVPEPGNRRGTLSYTSEEDKLVFGSDHTVSFEGLKGATKSQVKGLIVGSLVTIACGGIADALVGDDRRRNLQKAVDKVIDGLPNGVSKTPKWVMEQVANELLNLIPGVGWAQMIGGCIDQILDGFFNALEREAKAAADRLRASTGGDANKAFMKAVEEIGRNAGHTLYGYLALTRQGGIFDQLHSNPCNPAPATTYDQSGKVRGAWDPNDKISPGPFIAGSIPEGDSIRSVLLIPSSSIGDSIPYRIRFENKAQATDSATMVTIKDTLDENLDLATLKIDSALSIHPRGTFQWSLVGNVLTIQYQDIMLPPNVNPPEGEWQAVFSIKLRPNLPLGTRIRNRASIIFDFNPPIFTPEVIHIVGAPEISATATTVDFDSIPVGTTARETLWVKNIGGFNLAIGDIAGIVPPFNVVSNACTDSTLAPGDSCQLVVSFTPSSVGSFSGRLNIASSDLNRYPFAIQLSGVALPKTSVQNYPNPFNLSTTIDFELSETSLVTLKVYNVLGQEVATLLENEKLSKGRYSKVFDAMNLLSSVYFYRLMIHALDDKGTVTGSVSTQVRKMILTR